MRHILTLTFALVLSIAITGCADEALTPAPETGNGGEANALSQIQRSPTFLSRRSLSGGMAAKSNHNGFAGPLFGLATAPNGDILVADAGAGIVTRNGITDIVLPGVSDMSPLGRSALWALKGLTGDPGEDTDQALYRVSKGKNRLVADLFDFEDANNPDGGAVDSNPFDVQSLGGEAALVADAGANALLRVNNQGRIDVLAVLPNEMVSTANVKELVGCPASEAPPCGLPPEFPAQPVPTSIAIGPDGYYYVGELKGFPAPTGASNIWRIAPHASGAMCPNPDCQKVFDGGFTSIIDLAFDADGNLHVAELDENSWLAVEPDFIAGASIGGTINACDVDAGTCSEVATEIPVLTAITFGNDGALWATRHALPWSSSPAEVIQVQ